MHVKQKIYNFMFLNIQLTASVFFVDLEMMNLKSKVEDYTEGHLSCALIILKASPSPFPFAMTFREVLQLLGK